MEIIKEIREATFGADRYSEYDGYEVITDKQTIRLGITNYQDCCENWGYFWTNDNPQDFIGATLLGVKITDTCLNTEKAPDVYEGGVMFVTLETDRGDLQFVAYNEHNGYYGHDAVVQSEQLTASEIL